MPFSSLLSRMHDAFLFQISSRELFSSPSKSRFSDQYHRIDLSCTYSYTQPRVYIQHASLQLPIPCITINAKTSVQPKSLRYMKIKIPNPEITLPFIYPFLGLLHLTRSYTRSVPDCSSGVPLVAWLFCLQPHSAVVNII